MAMIVKYDGKNQPTVSFIDKAFKSPLSYNKTMYCDIVSLFSYLKIVLKNMVIGIIYTERVFIFTD